MNLYQQLSYLLLFRGYIILRCVCFFVIFSHYQQGVTVLYLYQQMRRDYKIKFTDKSKTNLWLYLDLTKVNRWNRLTSLYIISYLHFLKLIFWLSPKLFCSSLKLGLVWHKSRSPCFLPARFKCIYTSFRNQNKCKPSINANFHILKNAYHSLFESHLQYGTQLWGQKNNEIITFQTRQFKMAITWKLTFPPADSQWAIFEKSTKII